MQPEQYKRILGYYLEEAKEHLETIHQGLLKLQTLIDDPEELNTIFRATFSIKGGAAMLGFSSISRIVYHLEDYLKFLRYPIIADQVSKRLFLDVWQILNNLVLQIETEEDLTDTQAEKITSNSDYLFTLLNSHLNFLLQQSNYHENLINQLEKLVKELNINKILLEQIKNYDLIFWNRQTSLKLILVDTQDFLCKTFAEYFTDLPNVEVVHGHFQDLPFFDAVVTAASALSSSNNLDSAILNFFGKDVIKLLQRRIQSEYLGQQPIGTALIVETNHALHPFLIHTPSLRMQVAEAGNNCIYQATWATLLAIYKHNQFNSQNLQQQINVVAFPGLGTGIGRLPITEAAKQMSLAYKNFLNACSYIEIA